MSKFLLRIHKLVPIGLFAVALCLLSSTPADAQILNGSFSTGDFTDWNVVGGSSADGAEVVTSSTTLPSGVIAPTLPLDASAQALVQSTDASQGIPSVSASAIATTLDVTYMGQSTLPPTTYESSVSYDHDSLGTTYAADEGQAIYQTFTLSSESTLSFAYSYQTNDGYPFDSVGYVLDGVYTQLVQTPVFSGNANPTDYVTLTLQQPLGAGTHTLAFVAYNTGDISGPLDSTSLYVTDVTTTVTPEPGTWGLLVFGCAGLVAARKLRFSFARV